MPAMMKKECRTCPVSESCILFGLSRECVSKFSHPPTTYSIKEKGKTIFNQGQPITGVYVLCKGMVKLTKISEKGNEVIIDILRPCSFIGEINGGDRSIHGYSAITAGGLTELICFKIEDLVSVIRSHPTFAVNLSQQLSTNLHQAYRLIANMKLPVEERLIAILARVMLWGKGQSPMRPAKIPFSCRELAQLAQTTPETLSRVFRDLQKRGIIRVERKTVWLEKPDTITNYLDDENDENRLIQTNPKTRGFF